MYFEILQLSFACCKLMNTLTRVSLLSTYSHEQEFFYKFVSIFTNKLEKQLLSMTVSMEAMNGHWMINLKGKLQF